MTTPSDRDPVPYEPPPTADPAPYEPPATADPTPYEAPADAVSSTAETDSPRPAAGLDRTRSRTGRGAAR
ncbi:hypothetical protein [Amycolatopsis sp. VC5-11]|uniref:hypothetical protein n=1 Tax=Amycolatopsis sp. VC5-11 TaxID=3120156 RepID=UPI003008C490